MRKVGMFITGMLLLGCAGAGRRIDEAMDKLAWAEPGSEIWGEAVKELISLERTAARTLTAALGEAWFRDEAFREYPEERYDIWYGAAEVLGRMKYKAAADGLKEFLRADYPDDLRIKAAWALGEIGAHADPLAGHLGDPNPYMRLEVAIALCKMDDARGDSVLLASLGSGDEGVVRRAREGLREANYHAVGPLLSAFKDEWSEEVRKKAREVLEVLTGDLIGALKSSDRNLRRRAAEALGKIGDGRAADPLTERLGDHDRSVRMAAATALSKMGDERGIRFLFAALGSRDEVVRMHAIRALVDAGDAVVPELKRSLKDPNFLVRCGSARVLGQNRVKRAVPDLIEALGDSIASVRINAAVALGKIGSPEALSVLRKLVDDPDTTVAYYANWAIEKIYRRRG
ncbi:MAG TPA: HEAT repeat domain-containing protein [Candidatus Latescibacteria bacterium]|nr:HEAT repeat domain-containing protein [Candidatus Latescibacterota bacterium]